MLLKNNVEFSDRIFALITARGGSKGLVGKNIKPLLGKPLIGWTIEAAKNCKEIERVILSTDNLPIADCAAAMGCEVPFMRPDNLASDTASSADVVLHWLNFMQETEGKLPKAFFMLQPTSPLRNSNDLSNAVAMYNTGKFDAVISVAEPAHNPRIYKTVDENGMMRDMFSDFDNSHPTRQWLEQEFGKPYCPNGAIYLADTRQFLVHHKFYMEKCGAYIMPANRSVDIDTLFDFEIAEFIMQKQLQNQL